MKIYSMSTKCYFALGAIVSEDVSYKIKSEPFINGKAVPYGPKYHEKWIHNQARESGSPTKLERQFRADPGITAG
ncbi:hypothetical protein C5167_016683 [Papaver somniferum]|nr:hypothetical protein C5167_016683 [Papaver somniferum]